MNPQLIPLSDLPLIAFSSNNSGAIEFAINWRTQGDYNHIMWMTKTGIVASQGNTYSEVSVERYMKKNSRLKFVQIVGLTAVQKAFIQESIKQKLALPWYKKLYDWFGILGQAIGIEWINTPGLEFCSEDVPQHLKYLAKFMNDDNPLKKILEDIPRHTSPQKLNEYFKKFPEHFKVYGKWEADDNSQNVVEETLGYDKVKTS